MTPETRKWLEEVKEKLKDPNLAIWADEVIQDTLEIIEEQDKEIERLNDVLKHCEVK